MKREEIKAKVKQIVKDKSNVNQILDVLKVLEEENNEAKLNKEEIGRKVAALKGLVEIFQKYIGKGDLDQVNSDDDEAKVKYSEWLWKRFEEFWEKIRQYLTSGEFTLSEFAIVGGFRILQAFHNRRAQADDENEGMFCII